MNKATLALALILFMPGTAEAAEGNLSFTVLPVHYLVVNNDMQIILVVTNTGDTPDPLVYLGSANGPAIPYSLNLQQQYFALRPLIDFSLTGVVYGPLPLDEQPGWWGNLLSHVLPWTHF